MSGLIINLLAREQDTDERLIIKTLLGETAHVCECNGETDEGEREDACGYASTPLTDS